MALVRPRLFESSLKWRRAFCNAAQVTLDMNTWSLPIQDIEEHRNGSKMGIQWVFLGCPGVGKGTYASKLASLLSIPHIAMGDLIRQELTKPSLASKKLLSAMSQGQLLPDDVVLGLLSRRLEMGASNGEKGFILDGFPRTTSQAEILEQAIGIDMAVNLKLTKDILVTKCLGRRICHQCKKNFNIATIEFEVDGGSKVSMPPLLPPPACASKMTIRADDTEDAVRERLRVYAEESKPVEDFYRLRGKLLDFEVIGGIPETWPRLLDVLNLDERDYTLQKMVA
ncbi:hypothetical protein O6H91_02G016800 [Diphasiastrum complanatum]|uniref:Uncharacterized protein n=4 Tax=Diphasiastrum complanatum TaxID=34168 RepID=A0ACC2ED28_DIPCM|nr:hypothetical protein O6H91_02G016800 [Diphasiastrum complanatum]KAJ7564419.1 hypothetical protein O6H91_02G016800 [Diphasiastrum complanatum]KAJ7564420.1 hypothetical protein O6H91_02G016800 [Diphasiastrum complanatum]KAJ7564421.1 hypothetical protein O6H91_02G016800 [Diphasiastrum complanatum]